MKKMSPQEVEDLINRLPITTATEDYYVALLSLPYSTFRPLLERMLLEQLDIFDLIPTEAGKQVEETLPMFETEPKLSRDKPTLLKESLISCVNGNGATFKEVKSTVAEQFVKSEVREILGGEEAEKFPIPPVTEYVVEAWTEGVVSPFKAAMNSGKTLDQIQKDKL